ncbi:hypothetical protein BDQ17DRAFT_1328237 [Cyathus striatus]|nr:hypothetical protein BDQ17DRAFT_1328237 [Cyathus striatus]
MYRSERPDIYDNLSLEQKFSSDLVIWCILAKQLVTVAYANHFYVVQHTWETVLHLLIFDDGCETDYCTGLVFACECHGWKRICLLPEFSINVQFLFTSVDISKIYHSATIESDYVNLPTKSRKSPNTSALLTTFLLASWDNQGPPYFKDYCGEHASDFGGAIQSSGTFSMTWGGTSLSTRPLLSRNSKAHHIQERLLDEPIQVHRLPDTSLARTRVKRTKTTMENEEMVKEVAEEKDAWHELMKDDAEQEKAKETFIISDHESDIIARFREGFAVSKYDFEGLIEMCKFCESYFLAGSGIVKKLGQQRTQENRRDTTKSRTWN